MNVFTLSRSCALLGALVLVCATMISTARAADDVTSPQYQAWAKFKPGSSSTLSSDMTIQNMTMHMEMTTTLVSVTPDQAEVDVTSKAEMMGRGGTPNHSKRTIKAKEPARDYEEAGTEDVKAMDKTFKCKVIKLTGQAAADAQAPGGRVGRGPASNAKATIYVSPDVPGGIVKIEIVPTGSQPVTYILTGMQVK